MKNKLDSALKIYEDIIHLPHHVSSKRPQMALADRAAQFAPFAAVVGHETAVKEAARYTDQRKELDEMGKATVDEQLREIEAHLPIRCDVEIVYFQPDRLKAGGKYIVKVGMINKLDKYTGEIHMVDGTIIAVAEVYSIVYNPPKSDK